MAIENRSRKVVTTTLSLFICVLFAPVSQVSAQSAPPAVEQAFERATQLHQAGDLEGAIKAYKAILVDNPKRADVRSNLGAAYSRLGQYEEAIDQYKQALTLDANNQTIRFNLSMAYYKANLFTEAATELTRFLAEAPTSPQRPNASLVLADCQVRLGEYKKVIDLLTPLADASPTDRTIAYLLGSALIGDGQLAKGQAVIDRVFRDDDSAEARLLMGSILLLADDAQGALKELQRAVELNPKLPAVQATYGRVLMRLGDGEKAKLAFKTALANDANDFDANCFLGILLRQDKLNEEALAYLQRAVRLRPREQYARYHLAAVYAALGKPADARPLLEGVAREFPDFVEARVLLASVYYRLNLKDLGDREKATIQKLNAEQQDKQPATQSAPKPATQPE